MVKISDDDEEIDWGNTTPYWQCQECLDIPAWKQPPANWLNFPRQARLCRKCRSHAVIPIGL